MTDKYMQWIENASGRRSSSAATLLELGELYNKKLWHELTVSLETAIEDPAFAADGFIVDLYQNFISGFAHKINLLKLAFFAVAASKQLPTPSEGMAFLMDAIQNLEASKLLDIAEPVLYLRMQLAQYQLIIGAQNEAKQLMLDGESELNTLRDVDPQVSAAVHYVAMQYHKLQKNYAAFYRSALLYLAFVSQESLPAEFRLALAVDVSLAGLLGDDIYNFGELLLHPIMGALQESSYSWLRELLECFNAGDIHAYDALCARHSKVLNAQPALVVHERRLREKITVSSLIELVADLPPEGRSVPLSAIADRTKLPMDGVEFLLMKALALHLIEGRIDQISGTVEVSWVAPRVLTMPQVEALRGRLDVWMTRVENATANLEKEAVGVI